MREGVITKKYMLEISIYPDDNVYLKTYPVGKQTTKQFKKKDKKVVAEVEVGSDEVLF